MCSIVNDYIYMSKKCLTKSNRLTSFDNKFTICPVVVLPREPLLNLRACDKSEKIPMWRFVLERSKMCVCLQPNFYILLVKKKRWCYAMIRIHSVNFQPFGRLMNSLQFEFSFQFSASCRNKDDVILLA